MQFLNATSAISDDGNVLAGGIAQSKPSAISWFVWISIALWLLWFSDAWFYHGDAQVSLVLEKPFASVLRAVTIFLAAIYLPLIGLGRIINFFRNKVFLLPLLFCSAVSVLWSSFMLNSALAMINMMSLLVLSIYVHERMRFHDFINIYFRFSAAIVVISLIAVIVWPEYGLMQGEHAGKFKGLFPHKSNFALFLFVFISVVIFFWREIPSSSFFKAFIFLLSLMMLFFAESSTGVAILLIFSFVWLSIHFTKSLSGKYLYRMIIVIAASGTALLAVYLSADMFLELLGRDFTFTGRTQIWNYYFQLASAAPWVGHGFYSLQADPSLAQNALNMFYFAARSPHNSYLEIYYNVGMIGLISYILFVLQTLLSSLRRALTESKVYNARVAQFSFCLTVSLLAYGAVESYQSGLNAGLPLLFILVSHSVLPPTCMERRA
jgi:O-antigen ligase